MKPEMPNKHLSMQNRSNSSTEEIWPALLGGRRGNLKPPPAAAARNSNFTVVCQLQPIGCCYKLR